MLEALIKVGPLVLASGRQLTEAVGGLSRLLGTKAATQGPGRLTRLVGICGEYFGEGDTRDVVDVVLLACTIGWNESLQAVSRLTSEASCARAPQHEGTTLQREVSVHITTSS
mmetsp:Transcript_73615/g.172433  ORF Transcript_73615/g.172433 Transcript_73615/m.172433 type:complete len:113 (-) Transcript_73615:475-813(-)